MFPGMLPLIYKESSNFAVTHFYTFKAMGYLFMFLFIRLEASILVIVSVLLVVIALFTGTYIAMEIIVRLRNENERTAVNSGIIQQIASQTWLPKFGPLGHKQKDDILLKPEDIELENTVVSNKWTD